MVNSVLLDTSIIIDFLRVKDKKSTPYYLLTKQGFNLYISIITHTELYAGKSVWENKIALNDLKDLFEGVEILPYTTKISINSGQIRAKHNIDLFDAIIGATAVEHNLPLYTLNLKHFKKITGLEIFNLPEFKIGA